MTSGPSASIGNSWLLVAAVFTLALAIAGWIGGIRMAFGPRGTWILRIYFLLVLAASGGSAYYLTCDYSYFTNINTEFHGWPIPRLVLQRAAPDGPWLDYVGPTAVLAYPLNLLLIAAPILGLSWVMSRVIRKSDKSPSSFLRRAS